MPGLPQVLLVRPEGDALTAAAWRTGLAAVTAAPPIEVTASDLPGRLADHPGLLIVMPLRRPLTAAEDEIRALLGRLPTRRLLVVAAEGDRPPAVLAAGLLAAGAAGVLDDPGTPEALFAAVARSLLRIADGGRVLPDQPEAQGPGAELAGRIAAEIAAIGWRRPAADEDDPEPVS